MTDLKIPNLNKRSEKYLFKGNTSLRRKTKKKLLSESFFMIVFSLLLVFLNYLIPNKITLFYNFVDTFNKSIKVFGELISNLYNIFLVFFIIISAICIFILLSGAIYRIFKVLNRRVKQNIFNK